MIKPEKRLTNLICFAILILFLSYAHSGEGSSLKQPMPENTKAFAPRFIVNIVVDDVLTSAFYANDDGWSDLEFTTMFIANAITPIILFQNYHSLKPFLKTLAFTGGAFAATELVAHQIEDGYRVVGLRLLNWLIVMPLIASKLNYEIHLDALQQKRLNLKLFQPGYLKGGDNRFIMGVQILQLGW